MFACAVARTCMRVCVCVCVCARVEFITGSLAFDLTSFINDSLNNLLVCFVVYVSALL
jgi:hypothetical protein